MAHETMSAVGRMVGGCVSSGVVVSGVDWVQYLMCDVVVGLFRPCWWNRLRPVEDKGAHNTGFMRAHRRALPQVHAIIAGILIQNDVDGGVPFEDGKRYRNRALTSRRKLPTTFFCGEKKGINHGEIAMIQWCWFELCADGIGCSE